MLNTVWPWLVGGGFEYSWGGATCTYLSQRASGLGAYVLCDANFLPILYHFGTYLSILSPIIVPDPTLCDNRHIVYNCTKLAPLLPLTPPTPLRPHLTTPLSRFLPHLLKLHQPCLLSQISIPLPFQTLPRYLDISPNILDQTLFTNVIVLGPYKAAD